MLRPIRLRDETPDLKPSPYCKRFRSMRGNHAMLAVVLVIGFIRGLAHA